MQSESNTLSVDLLGLLDKAVQTKQFALVLLLDADSIVSHTDNEHVVAANAVGQIRMNLPVKPRANTSSD